MTKQKFLRSVSWVVLVTFSSLVTQPLQAAIQMPKPAHAHKAGQGARTPAPETLAAKQSRLLAEIHDLLKELEPEAAYPAPPVAPGKDMAERAPGQGVQPGVDRGAKLQAIKTRQAQLAQLRHAADADFDAVRQHLISKKLPAELLLRHDQAVEDYHKRRAEFDRLMQAVLTADASKADTSGPLKQVAAFMAAHPNQKSHTFSDPNKLPFGTPKGKVRAPIETEQGFKQSLFSPRKLHGWQPYTLAAAGSLSGITLPSTTVSTTPTAADLAETEDVQLTPAIRAQAAALSNNPVQIHNWVRNNIEFIPSYGSIQGADLTLQSKRGNAFDTASLEIALLRAAGIPARYAYGTVQLPADQVMNWVGGVTQPEAAQSLMAQGGIPNVALVSGGKITAFKLEHVWVEAWVDYVPSRGAVNKVGDTWIQLDGSFKQYAYTAGMDLKAAVPLDAPTLLDQSKQGATVNETEGWVQNLNQANLQTALTSYQAQVKTYIDSTKPDATVGDVLGSKTIQQQGPSILLGTLPYKTIVTGAKFAAFPANLKHQFSFTLYASDLDRALDSPTLSLTKNLPYLAGKKITLSFTPASQADRDLINSYLPKPHADGTPIQPSELPSSLPGYLIHLKAEIRVDGQIVSEGGNFTMGQELTSSMALNAPGGGWSEGEPNHPIAGEYQAIGLDMQGVSAGQLAVLKARLEQTKASLEQFQQNPNDPSPIQGLTKEDISGDMLYAGILGYFASVDGNDQVTARTGKQVVAFRLPSYGIFQTAVQPHYWFGIARNVSFPGFIMDVDRVAYHLEATDADQQKKIAYMRQVGSAGSTFEHAVPERLFAEPSTPITDPLQPQGFSAVKALAIAASQGQKIYTLNEKNQAHHAGIIAGLNTDIDTKAEISNALSMGKEVTVHQSDVTVNGWAGSGYILFDKESGAGAYKISGGANGGGVMDQLSDQVASFGGWLGDNLATLLDALSSILEDVGGVGGIFGKLAGAIAKVADFAKIVQTCSGADLFGGFQLLLGGILVAAGLLGFFGGFFIIPVIIAIIYSILMGILMGLVLDYYINQTCKD